MKITINTKQFQSVIDSAVKMSKKAKDASAADRSLLLQAEDNVLTATAYAQSISLGFDVPLSNDRVDHSIEEEGSFVILSDVLQSGIKPFAKSTDITLTHDEEGGTVTIEGSDQPGETVLSVPPLSSPDSIWGSAQPEFNEEDNFTTDVHSFLAGMSVCTPSGIPILDDAIILHPSDGKLTALSAEFHKYAVTMLEIPTEECDLDKEIFIKSDYAPVAMSAIDLFSTEDDKVKVSFDKGSGAVVYLILDSENNQVAKVWSTSPSVKNDKLYSMISGMLSTVAEEYDTIVTVPLSSFLSMTKASLDVGKATGYAVDSMGNPENNDPVHLIIEDGELTVKSMQKESGYTSVADVELTDGVPNDKVSFKLPMVMADPLIHAASFPGDSMSFAITTKEGKAGTSFILSFLPDTLDQDDEGATDFSDINGQTRMSKDRLLASTFTLVSKEV